MNTRNQLLDLTKFILSLCVVCIHSQLFIDVNLYLYQFVVCGITRIAVPMFFIISGYYFYDKTINHKNTNSYLIKIIKLYIFFELFEILFYSYFMYPNLVNQFGILGFPIRILTTGLGGAYWFLISLVISLFILKKLWKKEQIFPGLIIGFMFYVIAMSFDTYAGFHLPYMKIAEIHTYFMKWPQAGLVSSLLFLSLGACIHKYGHKLRKNIIRLLYLFLLFIIEVFYTQNHGAIDANMYFSLILLVPYLFYYILNTNIDLNMNTSYLANMSVYIYMLHPFVLNILGFVFHQTILKCLFVLLITIFLSHCIVKREFSYRF